MSVTAMLVLAVLCASAAQVGSAVEAEHAARLEARVEEALERMLGPGRAAATVEVHGERVTKREESSLSGESESRPASPPPAESAVLDLPGYAKSARFRPAAKARPAIAHAATEETLREASFLVTGVRARLVLDDSLGDPAVEEAVRVSGEILALDPARGDELRVVRTAFLPAWRAAFSRPRDTRAFALLCLGAAALLISASILGRALVRAARAFAAGRAAPAELRRPSAARRIVPLPPLEKGGRGS